jgi:hypothetical protein
MSTPAANYPPYIRSEKIDLKAHPVLNEKWLQARLAEDPSLLGLGSDLKLESKEHTVPSGGKLDLLFKDFDSLRYAVEVQLGAIDPSHIIRTIEYWLFLKDVPKCVPVLVAENFNVRFKNVVEELSKPFDLIAIQVQALEVGGQITLAFSTIFDKEKETGTPTDRGYWEKRAQETMPLVDRFFDIARSIDPGFVLVYNQDHISAAKDGNNFLTLQPQKNAIRLNVSTAQTADLDTKSAALGGEYKRSKYRFKLSPEQVTGQHGAFTNLIQQAYAGW